MAVATELESAIVSGRYAVGFQLPSERRLAEDYHITVMTVRGALKVLADKGLIVREQGRGTFVAPTVSAAACHMQSAPTLKPVGLIGLSPKVRPGDNVINWQLRLRRLQGIVDAASQLGLRIHTHVNLKPNSSVPRMIAGLDRFSGLVLHDESLPEAVLLALHERGVPVVAINCYLGADYCNRIHVNSRLGASRAVSHLIKLGHRRIAAIVGDPARLSMNERLLGYRDALIAHGLPFDDAFLIIESRGWPQDAAAATRRLLDLPERPTAIFAASDYRALGVLEQLRQSGMSVPDDMAVMGFDDIHEVQTVVPPLSTVVNPLYESGRLAAQILHAQIARAKPEVSLRVMECTLQVRGSCGAGMVATVDSKDLEKREVTPA